MTMADYQLLAKDPIIPTGMDTVLRVADGAIIPFDDENRDYQAYLEWLSQGNEPEPVTRVGKRTKK